MENRADIQQYLDVIRRRKFHIVVPAIVVFILAASLALLLPPVYKATATIMVESQEIPKDLVRGAVTGYVEERLQKISGMVFSRQSLLDVFNRFGINRNLKNNLTHAEAVKKFRNAIKIEPVIAEVHNPTYWKTTGTTVAFTLSYEGKEAEKVAQVTNYLASLLLEADIKDRGEKAQTSFEFLENQAKDLRAEILQIEERVADYKEKHINELPELMQLNVQTMEKLEMEINAKQENIKNLTNRKIYLEGQLATIEPTLYRTSQEGRRLLTPKEELEALRNQYLSLSASFSERHPDVITLKKKLAAMERKVSTSEDLHQHQRELEEKENRLALLSENYSEKYPDVVRLKKEVGLLKEEIQRLAATQAVPKTGNEKPENPAYINIQTQIVSTELEIESAKKELELIKQKYEDYRRRVENTPRVEKKYLDLQRNYANAKEKYDKIIDRLMVAKEAKGLEESRRGEKFTLVEPAIAPEKPYKPNRLAILLLGVVLAAGSGLGFGSVSEYMDHSMHRADELAKISGHTVLAVVPYLKTSQDSLQKRRRIFAFSCGAISLLIIGLAALHFLYLPLDILWLKFMDH
jgi:uncharacterized protein involved in exopolysaccharide biosynthesis